MVNDLKIYLDALKKDGSRNLMDELTIDRFNGACGFLSNFWRCRVELDGMDYPSVEHAYQAAKTLSIDVRLKMSKMRASEAKVYTYSREFEIRKDWQNAKTPVMLDLLKQKYAVEPFKTLLLMTDGINLVEGNHWHDIYWGVCNCKKCTGLGENKLGLALMKIRDSLKFTKHEN